MVSLSIDIGQSSQEKSNHFCVACVGSSHQRRHSSVGCRIKIGASIQKCPVDFNFAIQENCIHQSSHSIPVSGMHTPPCMQENMHGFCLAPQGATRQRKWDR